MAGAPIANMKYCRGCAAELHESARVCPKCGATQPGTGQKSRVAAAIMALLLGGVGIHKFYLGRVGWGVVYLIFCWTFIPALVAFVEGIIYLTMSDEAFSAKYD